ncbi:hypothetical protein C9417_20470 [Rhizobium sp. SEMIA 4088]|nr:hypothetical protein C9417_20470 [Rhizobium sp. SEMIA 4088]
MIAPGIRAEQPPIDYKIKAARYEYRAAFILIDARIRTRNIIRIKSFRVHWKPFAAIFASAQLACCNCFTSVRKLIVKRKGKSI